MSLPKKPTALSRKKFSSRPRRRMWMRRRNPLPRAPTGSFATRSETISLAASAGVVYDFNNLSLSVLPVASEIAAFYQYYRITSVQMRIKPQFDTFVAGGSAGTGVIPYLYFLYDKAGSLGALNAIQFEEAGAKPVRVDDKTIIRKWRPTVVTHDGLDGYPSQFKTSPWLPTFDTTGASLQKTKHYGAVWYISKINSSDATVYDIDITVTCQFRKPLIALSSTVQSVPLLLPAKPVEPESAT